MITANISYDHSILKPNFPPKNQPLFLNIDSSIFGKPVVQPILDIGSEHDKELELEMTNNGDKLVMDKSYKEDSSKMRILLPNLSGLANEKHK